MAVPSLLWFSFLVCVQWVQPLKQRDSGPYIVKLVEWPMCHEEGDKIAFELQTNTLGDGSLSHTGTVRFDVDLDKNVYGKFVTDKLSGDQDRQPFWRSKLMPYMCNFTEDLMPGFISSLTEAIKQPSKCPISKGEYHVQNYVLNTTLAPRYQEFAYGRFEVNLSFLTPEGARLGCIQWIFDVTEDKDKVMK